eukprot:jgi/Mesen1/4795/ME000243S03974
MSFSVINQGNRFSIEGSPGPIPCCSLIQYSNEPGPVRARLGRPKVSWKFNQSAVLRGVLAYRKNGGLGPSALELSSVRGHCESGLKAPYWSQHSGNPETKTEDVKLGILRLVSGAEKSSLDCQYQWYRSGRLIPFTHFSNRLVRRALNQIQGCLSPWRSQGYQPQLRSPLNSSPSCIPQPCAKSAYSIQKYCEEDRSRRADHVKCRASASLALASSTMAEIPNYSIAAVALGGLGVVLVSALSFVVVGVVLQPRWMIKLVRMGLPHITFEHVTQAPLVALTIDDGPNGATSHQLLDILSENECKATFFVIGNNMDKFPAIVERMHAEGHELGNHTMEDVASWRLTPEEFEKTLLDVDQRLQPFFHTDEHSKPMKWFRPGHGWYTKRIRRTIQKHGYRLALGSVYPVDPLFKEKGGPIAQYCLWKIYPGAIIVLHDRPQQENQTIEILSKLLPELRKRGYQVVTLSELVRNKPSAMTIGAVP